MSKLCMATVLCAVFFSGALHGQDRSVVLSYKTDTAPVIDGMIDGDEWDAAGPWINVTTESPNARSAVDLIDEDVFGGDEDISYRFKTMWEEGSPNFYIVYEIFDDIAMEDDPVNVWERDQMETFVEGTSLEGQENADSFHWWDPAVSDETYGKLGVSRYNTFEGNGATMTDDVDAWDEGFGGFNSISAVADMGTNADYRIEMGISIIQMIDDINAAPFEGTPTEDAGGIVQDSTVIKFTNGVSDDDNFVGVDTERSHGITYYREIDGVEGQWDQSNFFADLTFVGEFTGVIDVPGDCNGDGQLTIADLQCVSGADIPTVIGGLNLIEGDLDGDGSVGFPDFLVLSANFSQTVSGYAQGDVDGDGSVGFPDFLVLSANFGQSAAAVSAVPEPSSLTLVGIGCLLFAAIRRRRVA